jgi:glycosyltransferase involved in cell wall biosynthesis
MRYVLIVCYDFPRISAAGVIRTYQFAKRLPDFGWQPVILTAQVPGENQEENIEISDGKLSCPKISAAPSRLAVPVRADHRRARESDGPSRVKGKGYMTGFARFAVPDGKIGWLVPAVKRGSQIARDLPIEACLSVSPRPTAHLVANRLARRMDVPWVADFALPWSDAYWLAGRPRMIERLDRKLEGFVVRSAQQITVAYAELARSIGARYGAAMAEKISIIATGAEEEPFTVPGPRPARKFTVIYPGNHFCEPGRDGEFFLRAIDEWLATDRSLKEKVEFVFIGKRDEDLLRHRMAMANPKVVRVEPLICHRACIEAIRSSHACLVNTVGNRIPAKVYEYMRAGKPILVLAEPASDLARVVGDYSKAVVVPAADVSAIRQSLENLMHLTDTVTHASSGEGAGAAAKKYSSRSGAKKLAHIFHRLVESREERTVQ